MENRCDNCGNGESLRDAPFKNIDGSDCELICCNVRGFKNEAGEIDSPDYTPPDFVCEMWKPKAAHP